MAGYELYRFLSEERTPTPLGAVGKHKQAATDSCLFVFALPWSPREAAASAAVWGDRRASRLRPGATLWSLFSPLPCPYGGPQAVVRLRGEGPHQTWIHETGVVVGGLQETDEGTCFLEKTDPKAASQHGFPALMIPQRLFSPPTPLTCPQLGC